MYFISYLSFFSFRNWFEYNATVTHSSTSTPKVLCFHITFFFEIIFFAYTLATYIHTHIWSPVHQPTPILLSLKPSSRRLVPHCPLKSLSVFTRQDFHQILLLRNKFTVCETYISLCVVHVKENESFFYLIKCLSTCLRRFLLYYAHSWSWNDSTQKISHVVFTA